ncbi:MAG: twin-arginine translocase subunit TatC, partial [Muribaculaceae bacterium]|nr:twin-arginine translocase subunit TatC [Muribaculaceae bacterium]
AVFELPLLAGLFGRRGLLTRDFFGRYRRHAIVILMIVAAFITPTGDPFTLFVVFIPIYALWEMSARLVPRPQIVEDNSF